MILGEVYIGEMIMNNDYKNIIELKDGVDKDLSKEIKNICLEIYNKGEQLVKLVNIDDKRFELVTDEKGKNNLLIGVGLMMSANLEGSSNIMFCLLVSCLTLIYGIFLRDNMTTLELILNIEFHFH